MAITIFVVKEMEATGHERRGEAATLNENAQQRNSKAREQHKTAEGAFLLNQVICSKITC